jgi:hypothetical protein
MLHRHFVFLAGWVMATGITACLPSQVPAPSDSADPVDVVSPRPACTLVKGEAAVTFTLDEGDTFMPLEHMPDSGPDGDHRDTRDLVALDLPSVLLAKRAGTFYRSVDSGCTWTSMGEIEQDERIWLQAGKGGVAYGYSQAGGVIRVEGLAIDQLPGPGEVLSLAGLGTDPGNGAHLRIGSKEGALWDSTDGGETWVKIGKRPFYGENQFAYRIAFDPGDIDHIVVGVGGDGAFVTRDGGATWTMSTGLSLNGVNHANVMSVVISAGDGEIVWAHGVDEDQGDVNGFGGRQIWRSVDGGLTFSTAVKKGKGINLTSGTILAPHPGEPGVVYFETTPGLDHAGGNLFRYDHAMGELTNKPILGAGVGAFAFAKGDPEVMYVGQMIQEAIH